MEKQSKSQKTRGHLTLPGEENFYQETLEMLDRLGADAIRDSDGTELPEEVKDLDGVMVYGKYFTARGHNAFAAKHLFEASRYYLSSDFVTATGKETKISFMSGYFAKQITPDYDHDPKKWWEVRDRTTGEVLDTALWEIDRDHNIAVIQTEPFHVYSVSFLAYGIWDPVQMYNYLTNDWGEDVEKHIPFDIRYPESEKYVEAALEDWLKANPKVDFVRFTTFFYQFSLVFDQEGKEKYVDWYGYTNAVSPKAIEDFERAYGYRLTPEDFVDEGYYNCNFRVPSQAFRDYQDFTARFVAQHAKRLVDLVHKYNKKAIMFLGDHWIGVEPWGPYFSEIGLDGVVGSVGDGVTLRLISSIEAPIHEGRFLPYFFPDTFFEGNDEAILAEAKDNWAKARRALMREPLERIGYGGYLSLAYKFPSFINYIEDLANEYRDILARIENTQPRQMAKVAVLNSWGKLRSWGSHIVAHGKWYKLCYSYLGVLEALSGMDVEVSFINFEDVKAGLDPDLDVIINMGDAYTAFSGAENFLDPEVVTRLRQFVYQGGGFIGIGEPSAVQAQGRFFQLADVLGVDKEVGFSQSTDKYFDQPVDQHFITADVHEPLDFGETTGNVYALSAETKIIAYANQEVHLASHDFGQGRAVYFAGLPYSAQNTRLLKRAIAYASHKEAELERYFAQDDRLEVNAYPSRGEYCVINNSADQVTSLVYDGRGQAQELTLPGAGLFWLKDEEGR